MVEGEESKSKQGGALFLRVSWVTCEGGEESFGKSWLCPNMGLC